MSYASLRANAVFNLLERGGTLMVAEGLDVFKVKMPAALVGKTIAESGIRRTTGCTIIALDSDGTTQVNPDPTRPLPAEGGDDPDRQREGRKPLPREFVKD